MDNQSKNCIASDSSNAQPHVEKTTSTLSSVPTDAQLEKTNNTTPLSVPNNAHPETKPVPSLQDKKAISEAAVEDTGAPSVEQYPVDKDKAVEAAGAKEVAKEEVAGTEKVDEHEQVKSEAGDKAEES